MFGNFFKNEDRFVAVNGDSKLYVCLTYGIDFDLISEKFVDPFDLVMRLFKTQYDTKEEFKTKVIDKFLEIIYNSFPSKDVMKRFKKLTKKMLKTYDKVLPYTIEDFDTTITTKYTRLRGGALKVMGLVEVWDESEGKYIIK